LSHHTGMLSVCVWPKGVFIWCNSEPKTTNRMVYKLPKITLPRPGRPSILSVRMFENPAWHRTHAERLFGRTRASNCRFWTSSGPYITGQKGQIIILSIGLCCSGHWIGRMYAIDNSWPIEEVTNFTLWIVSIFFHLSVDCANASSVSYRGTPSGTWYCSYMNSGCVPKNREGFEKISTNYFNYFCGQNQLCQF
jgi:hypothetical protein